MLARTISRLTPIGKALNYEEDWTEDTPLAITRSASGKVLCIDVYKLAITNNDDEDVGTTTTA